MADSAFEGTEFILTCAGYHNNETCQVGRYLIRQNLEFGAFARGGSGRTVCKGACKVKGHG